MKRRRRKSPRWRIITLIVTFCILVGTLIQSHFSLNSYARSREEIEALITQTATRHGLSAPLVMALVWKESRFKPNAVGSAGEIGLMQVLDGAVSDWARINQRAKPTKRQLFTPETNLEIGCWYLAQAHKHWEGYASQDILELAEYNAGRTVVLREWAPEKPENIVDLDSITFPSTRKYIKQIFKRRDHYMQRMNSDRAAN